MIEATVLIYPQALVSSISLPLEMLSAADNFQRLKKPLRRKINLKIAALDANEIKTSGGLNIRPDCSVDSISHTDLIILPALWRKPDRVINANRMLLDWLKQMKSHGSKICAVGSGSFFLAEAGLLDDKPATTHWYYFDEFERRYPQIHLQRRHLITQAGSVFCAGSVNSVADLTVHFINDFYGSEIAQQVEGQFSPEIRQSYDSHLYSDSRLATHHDEDVVRAQQWLQSNFGQSISIAELARLSGLSTRTLNRRFKDAIGETPISYLQKIRINIAKELLRDSNLNIAEIAEKVGYSDCSYFSSLFRTRMSQSPKSYRQRVRGKLFTSD